MAEGMFSLDDRALTRVKRAESPIPKAKDLVIEHEEDPLDSEAARRLHDQLLDFYDQELERQAKNRKEMAEDEDIYDNDQWREEDKRTLEERGQEPLVYNAVANTLDWVIGTERRGKADFKVLPRRKEMGKPAEKKTALLKYLSDVNRTQFNKSRAFEDAIKAGVGWLEECVETDSEGEPLLDRYESWRNMLWDSTATQLDLTDARYITRVKWVDLDIALAMFPKRRRVLENSIDDGDRFFLSIHGDDPMDFAEHEREQVIGFGGRRPDRYYRPRIRIMETWFTRPVQTPRLKGGDFDGELFDMASPGHVDSVNSGKAEIVVKPTMRMYVALFTIEGLLLVSPSPYRHNRFPFTPIWGYRRGRDRLPYGMVRRLKSIQRDINKRASKILHILTTQGVIADEGAVEDVDEAIEELARPDFFITVRQGKKLERITDRADVQYHLELMLRSLLMIQQASGVTDENLGRKTNATSGVAIEARQDQGSTSTTGLFDNLRFASQVHGEKRLANIEQFMSERKQFRITDKRGTADFIDINDGLPENDIVRSKADYVISEADWRASVRQAQADQLLEILGKLSTVNPQVAVVMLDLVVESMDLPWNAEIVQRIRSVTGMRDPDQEEPTPEEMAREQQAAKEKQIIEARAMAELRGLIAKAVKDEASAQKTAAEVAKTNIATIGGPKRGAVDIAADLLAMPQVAAVADEMLRDAGYMSRADLEAAVASNIEAQRITQQQMAERAAQEQAAKQQKPKPNGKGAMTT